MEDKNRFCQREHDTTTLEQGWRVFRESFLEEVEFNDEHDFGKRCWDRGVPGIPDREQERQRPGGGLLWGQDRLKRKVPDSGT